MPPCARHGQLAIPFFQFAAPVRGWGSAGRHPVNQTTENRTIGRQTTHNTPTRQFACCAQPAARGCATRSRFQVFSDSIKTKPRCLCDRFDFVACTSRRSPGAGGGEVYLRAVCSLLVALAVRSLCFCLQRSLCAAVAAGASAEVETKEMTNK